MIDNERAQYIIDTKYPVLYDMIREIAEQCGEFDVEMKTIYGSIRFTSK